MINITLSSVISLLTQYGIQEKTHSERFQKLRLVTNINIFRNRFTKYGLAYRRGADPLYVEYV